MPAIVGSRSAADRRGVDHVARYLTQVMTMRVVQTKGPSLTRHAQERMRQRGYKSGDIALIEEVGTYTPEGLFLRDRDVAEAIQARKSEIAALERLAGTLVVIEGDTIITVQRTRRWKERSILQRAPLERIRRSAQV